MTLESPPTEPPSVLIFDVNETLLDLESLGPHFERMFGGAGVYRTWFDELIKYSMTLTLSGYYVDFFTLGRSVLQMLATTRDVVVTDDDLDSLAEGMRTMPAHPDVAPGLARLRDAGYRLVTLTNSPHRPNVASPLDNAGLGDFFEHQFTVDTLGLFKPSIHLYRRVAAQLGVDPSHAMMVAAHTWDILGAQGAGLRGALITRPGHAPLVAPGVPQPDLLAVDVTELASLLERRPDTPPTA
ncbi:haloacid dehalogenase type II [Mycolicibacterium sp. P1-18]|uniref:haloacid dehalogenase type II n=1 Tax=Mycolicibacterium sp. P1-18 TaxID=2024615 RepID=UPI0011F0F62B|nr:haloacid dehalogenase type II [Mycolicibacterium sp. P1-18]KAA0098863.1 haloacid dehalogenase type II [Mycolicibacterium sp. P1-18]